MGNSIEDLAESEVMKFLKSKGSIPARIKVKMADILRKNAEAGIIVTLQQAYDQATLRTLRN